MKNRLITQTTEYDCGPTSVVNALRFLYAREELPPCLVKGVWTLCNDTFNMQGEHGKRGTSRAAMRYLCSWLNGFAEGCQFPIRAAYQDGDDAVIAPGSLVETCLMQGGAAVVRCWSEHYRHYVLLTQLLEGNRVGIFDPYDEPDELVSQAPGLKIVHGEKYYNLILPMETMNLHGQTNYALGDTEDREILMLWRTADPIPGGGCPHEAT